MVVVLISLLLVSISLATEAIKKLGYERLETLKEGLRSGKFHTYEFDELTQEEQHICKAQKLSQEFKQASKDPFPASFII